MAELRIWLDTYDDIFSDFDSRGYRKRRISEDFIEELKASTRYRHEPPEAILIALPPALRNAEIETEIISSIKDQFSERERLLQARAKKMRARGLTLFISGMLIMIADAIISLYKITNNLLFSLIKITTEPAAWFMVWHGLDSLIYDLREINKEHGFYKIASGLSIRFIDL